jgi:hypothetical protein
VYSSARFKLAKQWPVLSSPLYFPNLRAALHGELGETLCPFASPMDKCQLVSRALRHLGENCFPGSSFPKRKLVSSLGRVGPDKQQALSLGIFYEDNLSKKRWVLKASDPKTLEDTLEDIDAVFVTVEPTGGSEHRSGKQLLFAYLRITPDHP